MSFGHNACRELLYEKRGQVNGVNWQVICEHWYIPHTSISHYIFISKSANHLESTKQFDLKGKFLDIQGEVITPLSFIWNKGEDELIAFGRDMAKKCDIASRKGMPGYE